MSSLQEWQKRWEAYHTQTLTYIEEIRHVVRERKKRQQVITYFTYALDLAHQAYEESLCFGSFHVKNVGDVPLNNPIICLKPSEDSPFSFSGRYVTKKAKATLKVNGGWERLDEDIHGGEWWFKPLGKTEVKPGETLSFSNFQLKWTAEETYKANLNGFFYSDQYKEGVPALNGINLHGRVWGDDHA